MIRCSALIFDLLHAQYYAHERISASLYQVSAWLLYYKSFYKDCYKVVPMMVALCLMLSETYYTQNYAGIIGLGPAM